MHGDHPDLVTAAPRAGIVQDIMGHPKGAPSVREIGHLKPDMKRNAITYHLGKLVDAGVVEKIALPKGERQRELPSTFYRLTDEGRALLERHGLWDEKAAWEDLYDRVEKPPAIERAEAMERP